MRRFLFWLGMTLVASGFLCLAFACIMQTVACIEKFGVAFEEVFVPHWSAWFYFGIIPLIGGWILAEIYKD